MRARAGTTLLVDDDCRAELAGTPFMLIAEVKDAGDALVVDDVGRRERASTSLRGS